MGGSVWRVRAFARIFRRLEYEVDGAEASPMISGGLRRHSASTDAGWLAWLYTGTEQTAHGDGMKEFAVGAGEPSAF